MMAALFAAIIVTLVFVEIVYRAACHVKLKPAVRSAREGFAQFRKADADEERQRLLLEVGLKTLLLSTAFLSLCVALCVIAFAPLYLFSWDSRAEITYFSALTLLSIVWFYVRVKHFAPTGSPKMSQGRYGFLDRCLHQLALGSKTLRKITFDLDKATALPTNGGMSADSPVYVCGLARSGTTMLLEILDQSENFRSLSYRHMPFVMAPNLWAKISRHGEKQSALAERAHGDGVYVGYDSPEAFEEVFWQSFDDPATGACYGMPPPEQETLEAFAQYRTLVANPKGRPPGPARRYLSKNNNNLLRLSSLCAEPSAAVLLVYRDPVATARSLYAQHQRFLNVQREDAFTLRYMQWLGHHEFGLGHKAFCFAAAAMNPALKPDQLDYWLDYWNAVHAYVLEQEQERIHLIHHDSMCAEPGAFLSRLFALLGVSLDAVTLARGIRAPKNVGREGFSSALLQAAYETYGRLLQRNNNILVSNMRQNSHE